MNIYDPRYQEFLRRLRQARKESGLSQKESAQRLCKPQSYVSKCEAGERRVDFVEAVMLARVYGKSILYFSKDILGKDHTF